MSGFNIELMNRFSSSPSPIRPNESSIGSSTAERGESKSGGVTFGDLLTEKISEANEALKDADSKVEELVAGRSKNIHGTMIALEKADISYKMLMQVRNKMLDAYREIMRMQV